MSDNNAKKRLNFELPSNETNTGNHQSKTVIWILLLIFIAISVNIFISLKKTNLLPSHHSRAELNADQQKKLALKLESQGLSASSAIAWKEYLNKTRLENSDAALIWYRIGKLFQDDHAYENALDSYYRSESYDEVDSISAEIAIRIQECLESMGKFSAMRHELTDRVSMDTADNAEASEKVVAEIGTNKITAADLDRRMEGSIDQQITMMAPYLPEEERNKQKKDLLKQFSNPSNRMMFLNQFVVEEILYRKAREEKLTENRQVRDLIKDQEKSLLARLFLEREYDRRIKITVSDLETYYEANKETFIKDDTEQTFDAVKNDVYKTLRTKKEQEIQHQLLTQLKDQYDVVIHQSAFPAEKPQTKNKAETKAESKAESKAENTK
jgi:hypothetical protein